MIGMMSGSKLYSPVFMMLPMRSRGFSSMATTLIVLEQHHAILGGFVALRDQDRVALAQ